jgi:hypothetical protein
METLTPDRTALQDKPDAAHTPPPLRLPKYLLAHLAKPLNNCDDVDRLMAQIRLAEWRGLL